MTRTVFTANRGWPAAVIVKDGGTHPASRSTCRLDGIDAPELDQMCIDQHADPWACCEARHQLSKLIDDALTKPDRRFCSEEDAQAAGFRRAYNCRASIQKPM